MTEHSLSRRQLGLLFGSAAVLTLPACATTAPAAALAGAGTSSAASAINFFGKTLGLAVVGNELTKVVDFMYEKTVEHFQSRNLSPPIQVQPVSSVYYSDSTSYIGNVYAAAIAIQLAGNAEFSEPVPVMYAANGDFVNLVPRAVLSIAATKSLLTAAGVGSSSVPEFTLPINGDLAGTRYDVSYRTTRGRLEVAYDKGTNTETVTVTGVPGHRLLSWSFPVDSLPA